MLALRSHLGITLHAQDADSQLLRWGRAGQQLKHFPLLFAKVSESFEAVKQSLFPYLFWLGRFYPCISISEEWKEKFCLVTAFLVKEAMGGIGKIKCWSSISKNEEMNMNGVKGGKFR